MKDWIEKNLDPPGMEKKNLRSIFSFIGRVFGIVKDDAVKAHNSFFPYLCEPDKLQEHGDVLLIPRLPYDTEEEYRNRVTTASFYLMRAGERSYIHEQLQSHFGDKYLLTEDFLQVLIQIMDLSDEDRKWVFGFLDGILDPNISFSIAEWFRFVEKINISERKIVFSLQSKFTDNFSRQGKLFYSGRVLYDGITDLGVEKWSVLHDGQYIYNNEIIYEDHKEIRAERDLSKPFLYSSGGLRDKLSYSINTKFSEKKTARLFFNNSITYNGTEFFKPYGEKPAYDVMRIWIMKHRFFNRKHRYCGQINHDSNVLIPLE